MKKVELTRTQGTDKATLGELVVSEGPIILFRCFTIELPWKKNASATSCIPIGTYPLRWTVSPRFTREANAKGQTGHVSTYEVCNVEGRTGIRVHAANYAHQLKGCIAPGLTAADIDGDGVIDVTSSKVTLKRLEDVLAKEPATLLIKWK